MNQANTSLARIESVKFGFGGYQDAQFGLSLTFLSNGIGVSTFLGYWSCERSENTKWTETDRITYFGELCMKIAKMLEIANISDVSELKGIPVELTWDGPSSIGATLKDWRILTEVLP